MVECLTCGGRYEPMQADGTRYFHACPPLSAPELAEAVAAGRVRLPDGETVDDAIARRSYERADKRDENRASTADTDAGRPKAEGRGVRDVTPDADAAAVVVVRDGA